MARKPLDPRSARKRASLALAVVLLMATPALAAPPSVTTPDWAKHAVFYQIFPERFADGDPANDPVGVEPWGGKPTPTNFMGGDLEGVTRHLPYLKALGVTALYFNPIFVSTSNHKYNTADYMHVDPHFGGDAAFLTMLHAAHRLGMHVILDGVFNHTATDSAMFQDCVHRGPASPYWHWYHFDGYPVVETPKPNYTAWWGIASLPKLMVATNPQVEDYIYSVETHWLKLGIDGWRLDVPNEIDSDAFWEGFRRRAKAIDPDAYLVGEIWHDAHRWLKGDQFDAVMDYPWRDLVLGFFARRDLAPSAFDSGLRKLRDAYPPAITDAMFNLLDSHDTERFLTDAGGDLAAMKLAVLFQMTYPGAPVVYYGDEVGMQGDKDPDCRRCMVWNPAHQDRDLLAYYRWAIALRHAHPALSTGTFTTLLADDATGVYAYARTLGHDRVVVVLNNGNHPFQGTIGGFPVRLPARRGRVYTSPTRL